MNSNLLQNLFQAGEAISKTDSLGLAKESLQKSSSKEKAFIEKPKTSFLELLGEKVKSETNKPLNQTSKESSDPSLNQNIQEEELTGQEPLAATDVKAFTEMITSFQGNLPLENKSFNNLREFLTENLDQILSRPIMSVLLGKASEGLDWKKLERNPFIKEALTSPQFLSEKRPVKELISMLGLNSSLAQRMTAIGLDEDMQISPTEFFKCLGLSTEKLETRLLAVRHQLNPLAKAKVELEQVRNKEDVVPTVREEKNSSPEKDLISTKNEKPFSDPLISSASKEPAKRNLREISNSFQVGEQANVQNLQKNIAPEISSFKENIDLAKNLSAETNPLKQTLSINTEQIRTNLSQAIPSKKLFDTNKEITEKTIENPSHLKTVKDLSQQEVIKTKDFKNVNQHETLTSEDLKNSFLESTFKQEKNQDLLELNEQISSATNKNEMNNKIQKIDKSLKELSSTSNEIDFLRPTLHQDFAPEITRKDNSLLTSELKVHYDSKNEDFLPANESDIETNINAVKSKNKTLDAGRENLITRLVEADPYEAKQRNFISQNKEISANESQEKILENEIKNTLEQKNSFLLKEPHVTTKNKSEQQGLLASLKNKELYKPHVMQNTLNKGDELSKNKLNLSTQKDPLTALVQEQPNTELKRTSSENSFFAEQSFKDIEENKNPLIKVKKLENMEENKSLVDAVTKEFKKVESHNLSINSFEKELSHEENLQTGEQKIDFLSERPPELESFTLRKPPVEATVRELLTSDSLQAKDLAASSEHIAQKVNEHASLLLKSASPQIRASFIDQNLGLVDFDLKVKNKEISLKLHEPSEKLSQLFARDVQILQSALSAVDLDLVRVDINSQENGEQSLFKQEEKMSFAESNDNFEQAFREQEENEFSPQEFNAKSRQEMPILAQSVFGGSQEHQLQVLA